MATTTSSWAKTLRVVHRRVLQAARKPSRAIDGWDMSWWVVADGAVLCFSLAFVATTPRQLASWPFVFSALAISFSTAQAAEHKTQIFFPLLIHGTHQTLLNGPPPSCPRALELQTTGSYERLPAVMPLVDRSCGRSEHKKAHQSYRSTGAPPSCLEPWEPGKCQSGAASVAGWRGVVAT